MGFIVPSLVYLLYPFHPRTRTLPVFHGIVGILTVWLFLTAQPVLAEVTGSNAFPEPSDSSQPGIQPNAFGNCPLTHPIKGNFTTHSGEPCIFHMPHQKFYGKTKAERCYATEEDAQEDGCRKSKR